MVRGGIGLREAFARLDRAREAQLEQHVANAAVEAAMWITALDDLSSEASGDRKGYRTRRDAHPDGAVILGLRWARDRGVHSVIADHHWEPREGFKFPIVFPAATEQVWHVTWGPPSKSSRPDAKLIEAYETHCSGNEVSSTLIAAARWFGMVLV